MLTNPLTFLIVAHWVVLPFVLFGSAIKLKRKWKMEDKWNATSYAQQTGREFGDVYKSDGSRAEFNIYQDLSFLESHGYKFLFNLYLPLSDGNTTEIDVVLVGYNGLIVIESKDYGGTIYGREYDSEWTQVFPKYYGNSEKHHFYNPIKQNKTHCNVLRQICPDVPIQSLIVFSDRSDLRVEVNSPDVLVIQRYQLSHAVGNMIKYNTGTNINPDNIYERLLPYTNASEETKRRHREYAQQQKVK